jgi:hypothetical protein
MQPPAAKLIGAACTPAYAPRTCNALGDLIRQSFARFPPSTAPLGDQARQCNRVQWMGTVRVAEMHEGGVEGFLVPCRWQRGLVHTWLAAGILLGWWIGPNMGKGKPQGGRGRVAVALRTLKAASSIVSLGPPSPKITWTSAVQLHTDQDGTRK